MHYTRESHNASEIVSLMQERGLIINNKKNAEETVREIGYFRFKGYCVNFYESTDPERFKKGTKISDVYAAYLFDSHLRTILIQGCQSVEVELKAAMSMEIAQKHGPILSAISFKRDTDFEKFQERFDDARKKGILRKERYVKHYIQKYDGEFPIWVDVELLTMGNASKLFSLLSDDIKKQIATSLSITSEEPVKAIYLESWVHWLTILRNVCAHNSRLFGRHMPIKAKIARKDQGKIAQNTVYTSLFIFFHLLPKQQFAQLVNIIDTEVKRFGSFVDISKIGFPADWKAQTLSRF